MIRVYERHKWMGLINVKETRTISLLLQQSTVRQHVEIVHKGGSLVKEGSCTETKDTHTRILAAQAMRK